MIDGELVVVSLWEPWATAVAAGLKSCETRSWPCPTSMLGARVGVHAARTRRGCDERPDLVLEVAKLGERLHFGQIVATATIVDCVQATASVDGARPGRERRWGDYTPGRWVWRLDDVERLDVPVAFIGGQGLSRRWRPAHEDQVGSTLTG